MDFVYDLTVPADTARATPAELEVDISAGVIVRAEIEIPPGPNGMVYAAVRQGLHQILPTNPDGFYHSDGRVYSSSPHKAHHRGDSAVVIMGWSPGTTYDHTIQFRFEVQPEATAEPWREIVALMKRLLKVFGVR